MSGDVNHLVTSGDPLYDGLVVDGIDLNVATPTTGNVIITETDGFTAVREGGPVSIDKYFVRLAADPDATSSTSRSPPRARRRRRPNGIPGRRHGLGLHRHEPTRPATTRSPSSSGHIYLNSDTPTDVPQRAIVLKFTGGAELERRPGGLRLRRRRPALRGRPRRRGQPQRHLRPTRATTARSSATSRSRVRDNDTPGVFVAPGAAGHDDRGRPHGRDRGRRRRPALTDELLVRLTAEPSAGVTIVVHLTLDADSEEADLDLEVERSPALQPGRAARSPSRSRRRTTGTPRSASSSTPRDNDRRQDPRTAVISSSAARSPPAAATTATPSRASTRRRPGRRRGARRRDRGRGRRRDRRRHARRVRRRHGRLLRPSAASSRRRRSRRRDPHRRADRREVDQDGARSSFTLQPIGGYVPTQLFIGDVTLGNDGAGADHDHARRRRQLPRRGLRAGDVHPDQRRRRGERRPLHLRTSPSRSSRSTATGAASGSFQGAIVSKLVREGLWQGDVTSSRPVPPPTATRRRPAAASSSARSTRTTRPRRAGSPTGSSRASASASARPAPRPAPTSRSRSSAA